MFSSERDVNESIEHIVDRAVQDASPIRNARRREDDGNNTASPSLSPRPRRDRGNSRGSLDGFGRIGRDEEGGGRNGKGDEGKGPKPKYPKSELRKMVALESYKSFMTHQEENAAPEVYLKRYEEYKTNYGIKLKQAFFDDHKKQLWLQERYSPAIQHRARLEKFRKLEKEAKKIIDRSKEYTFDFDQSAVEVDNSKRIGDEEAKEGEVEKKVLANNGVIDREKLLFIRRIPCACPEAALYEALKIGGDFVALYLSDPAKKAQYEFDRAGWIEYKTKEEAMQALPKIQNAFLQDSDMRQPVRLQLSIHRFRHPLRTPASMSLPSRIAVDKEKALRLAKLLDSTTFRRIHPDAPGIEEFLATLDCNDLAEDALNKKVLDAAIGYLRIVHFYVYYAGAQCRDLGDILHTHPALFCRPPISDRLLEEEKAFVEQANNSEADDTIKSPHGEWVLNMDKKVDERIAELEQDDEVYEKECALAKQVEELEDEALEPVYSAYASSVDGSEKQRCDLCKKLFKALPYVKKHIRNKHPELVMDKLAQVGEPFMWERYSADSNRPTPQILETTRVSLSRRGGNNYRSRSSRGRDNYRSRDDYGSRGRQSGGYHQNGGGNYGKRSYSRGNFRPHNDDPRAQPLPDQQEDPRKISTSYKDVDNVQTSKVELDFDALSSLPPPKKRRKA